MSIKKSICTRNVLQERDVLGHELDEEISGRPKLRRTQKSPRT